MKARRSRRASVLVEAVCVVAVFVIFFGGLAYFRRLYLEQISVARLARATAMAHAMGACKGEAADRLGPALGARRMDGKTAGAVDLGAGSPGSDNGSRALDQLREQRGDRALPITTITLTGDPASATSYVACTDEVTDHQYDALADTITSLF